MAYTYVKSVGPNASAGSDSHWLRLDEWAGGDITFQTTVSGSVVYDIDTTNDDPNSLINPVAINNVNWDSNLTNIVGASANAYGTLVGVPTYMKIHLQSGTGKVTLTVTQSE